VVSVVHDVVERSHDGGDVDGHDAVVGEVAQHGDGLAQRQLVGLALDLGVATEQVIVGEEERCLDVVGRAWHIRQRVDELLLLLCLGLCAG
jgi:hypothetical protein